MINGVMFGYPQIPLGKRENPSGNLDSQTMNPAMHAMETMNGARK